MTDGDDESSRLAFPVYKKASERVCERCGTSAMRIMCAHSCRPTPQPLLLPPDRYAPNQRTSPTQTYPHRIICIPPISSYGYLLQGFAFVGCAVLTFSPCSPPLRYTPTTPTISINVHNIYLSPNLTRLPLYSLARQYDSIVRASALDCIHLIEC